MDIRDLIYRDDLTGLYNRRAFRESLEKELSQSPEQIRGLYLVLTDLDHFKKINDTYGHLSGDFMIKKFAWMLEEGLKDTHSLIARYGGDEFVIILKEMDAERILSLWDGIRQRLSQTEFTLPESGQKVHVTMSIGIAEYSGDGRTADELFSTADEALYSSKELGRDRLYFAKDILAQIKEEKRIKNNILNPPFVDREKELKEINNCLFKQNPNKLILINGEVGSGKSRVLKEVVSSAKSHNSLTFFLTCSEIQKDKPYGFIADIINTISYSLYEVCKKAFDSLQPKQQAVLSVIPTLKIFTESLPTLSGWDADMRLSLFHALADLTDRILCELKPIIVVENVDWIDAASADIISYLIVSQKYIPLRICASDSRPPEMQEKRNSFLDKLLYEISEFEIVPHISLNPFSEPQTYELIRKIFMGIDVPWEFAHDIYRTTQGNLFFICELLGDLLERKIIYLKYPSWVFNESQEEFPESLKELLINKLENLDEQEKELLLAMAGMGSNFRFDFLGKLKKINSGYIQDIISKAAGINIFEKSEADKADTVSFHNEMMRTLLYDKLDAEAKKKLHLDIAMILENEHRDNIETVSPELAFHFNQAALEPKVKEYASRALVYMDKLFSNVEVEKMIEHAMTEREEKDRQEPIRKEAWPLVMEIIVSFNAAIRTIRMYQMRNVLASELTRRLYLSLDNFFQMHDILTFSSPQGELKEHYKLLINGQEFSAATVVEDLICRRLLHTMMMVNIGSITFHRTVMEQEITTFINILANQKSPVEEQGGWKKILHDNNISAITIDEVLYKKVLSEEEKKQFQKEFIKEFIVKKAVTDSVALTQQDILSVPPPGEVTAISSKVTGVTQEEKNVFTKTIAHLPVNMIVDIIANEYAHRKNTIFDIKEMVGVCLKESPQKKELLILLQERLEKLGISKEALEWLIDETEFLKYPVKKRANTYLATDAKTILEMGVVENLLPTLTELFGLNETKAAEDIIDKYLTNLRNPLVEFRAYMAATLSEAIQIIPAHLSAGYMKKISRAFVEALQSEDNPTVYELTVKNTPILIQALLKWQYYWDIYTILSMVKDDASTSGEFAWKKDFAQNALRKVDTHTLNKQLVAIMGQVAFDINKDDLIIRLFKKLLPESIPYLMELLLNRHPSSLLFEWYLQNLRVIELLKDFKDETLGEVNTLITSGDIKKIDLAFDILKRLHDEGFLDFYEKTLQSKDNKVRELTFMALIELDTNASLKKVWDLFPAENQDIQKEIILALGQYSHNQKSLDFLNSILNLKEQRYNKNEILATIKKIRARIKTPREAAE